MRCGQYAKFLRVSMSIPATNSADVDSRNSPRGAFFLQPTLPARYGRRYRQELGAMRKQIGDAALPHDIHAPAVAEAVGFVRNAIRKLVRPSRTVLSSQRDAQLVVDSKV